MTKKIYGYIFLIFLALLFIYSGPDAKKRCPMEVTKQPLSDTEFRGIGL